MDKSKVFVSYARKDTEQVLPLVERLERGTGVRFWIDRKGIESAAQFEDVIIQAIDDAEVVLCMLSDNAQDSQYTRDEITYGMFYKFCRASLPGFFEQIAGANEGVMRAS